MFKSEVYVKTDLYGFGIAKNKKEAEMLAAKNAINSIKKIDN